MAQPSSGKGDLRGAAERIERGIEKYGAGDVEGALAEFEEALRLYPASARGQSYASFARDLTTGKRTLPTAPQEEAAQEALRQVTAALDENDTSPYRPAIGGPPPGTGTQPGTGAIGTAPTMQAMDAPPPAEHRERRLTPSPPLMPQLPGVPAMRERRVTQPPPPSGERQRRPSAPPEAHEESPWDPVPLTPTGHEQPREAHRLEAAQTSSTILGMPPLEPSLLSPPRRRVLGPIDDRQESVTREFRSATPTGPNLQPLDVPELTEDQIQGLLSLDGLPESPTTPQIELERIDGFVDSPEERMVEMEAVPTPLPAPAPPGLRKNDTTPMGLQSFGGNEFEPAQLTPTGIKAMPPKPVRVAGPEDDPYADLNLLPLDAEEPEEGGTHPTNPFIRGPKLAEYAGFPAGEASGDERVEELPPLPTLPGARSPYTGRGEQPTAPGKPSAAAAGARGPAANDGPAPTANASAPAATSPSGGPSPLAAAEAALAAGNAALAVDECEKALAAAGGPGGELARSQTALVEQVYTAILRGPHRIPVHGVATANLDPRSAFLLSRIDGALTVEDVLDVSGMPRLEALRVMALLVRRGALVVK